MIRIGDFQLGGRGGFGARLAVINIAAPVQVGPLTTNDILPEDVAIPYDHCLVPRGRHHLIVVTHF